MAVVDVVSLENEIRLVVAKIVEAKPEKIAQETRFIEELGADSMMMLEILVAIEKKYKIQISESDLPKMINLKHVVDLVAPLLRENS